MKSNFLVTIVLLSFCGVAQAGIWEYFYGSKKPVEEVFETGYDATCKLHEAIKNHNLTQERLEFLVQKGADIYFMMPSRNKEMEGSFVDLALQSKNEKAVKLLSDRGVRVEGWGLKVAVLSIVAAGFYTLPTEQRAIVKTYADCKEAKLSESLRTILIEAADVTAKKCEKIINSKDPKDQQKKQKVCEQAQELALLQKELIVEKEFFEPVTTAAIELKKVAKK